MNQEPLVPPRQSAGQLTAELGVRTATLFGQEYALARAEMRATARTAGTGATLLGSAAALGLSAWTLLLAAAVAGLAVVLPVWAAALIVFGALALPAAILAAIATRWLARARPLLPLTTQSLREDFEAAREWARR